MSPDRTRGARQVLVGACLNAVGTGFVLPFIVIYLHEVRHITLAVAGAIVALEGLVGLLAVPAYGALIDRFGAKSVQIVSLALSAVGAVSFGLARTAPQAAGAMALASLGNAGFWPASQALIAALVPAERRSRYFALDFVAVNLGIGLGGLAAAAIVRPGHAMSYELLFFVNAATFLVDIALLAPVRVPRLRHLADQPGSYRTVLASRPLRGVLVVQFVLVLSGYAQLEAGFPAYVRSLGVSPRVVGLAFAANTGAIVAGQLWVHRRTAALPRTRALVIVATLWSGGWIALAVARWVPHAGVIAILFAVVFGAGEMFFAPTIPAIVNDLVPEHLRGRANATTTFGWAAAGVLGPAVAGAMLGAGASLAWLGLAIAGCAAAAVGALRLERILPRQANGGLPAPSVETALTPV